MHHLTNWQPLSVDELKRKTGELSETNEHRFEEIQKRENWTDGGKF